MVKNDVLVVGNGGREYELTRQLGFAGSIGTIYVAPGNAGTSQLAKAENIAISPTDNEALVAFARQHAVKLVVIGPEAPLIGGLADDLRSHGIAVFGPGKQAARLEASKAFAATFMARHAIPQPAYQIVRTLEEGLAAIKNKPADSYVLKADGLAGGKGVVLPQTTLEAEEVLRDMFGAGFDGAGHHGVVIQERLSGPEVSAFAVSDGKEYILLPFAQDHKRLQDHDQGPNTGGMGAYAPVPSSIVDEATARKIHAIAKQTIEGMAADGMPYQGVLYIGLMLAQERGGEPVVIEYNARFGDPETQVVLPILHEAGLDVAAMFQQAAQGDITGLTLPGNTQRAALTVCLAAAGYPAAPRNGSAIAGLDRSYPGVIVHHGSTKRENSKTITAGGRALYVTSIGDTISQAAARAYAAIGPDGIHFDGMQYRTDIGHQARH